MRPQLDALPPAVRERGRQALERPSLWAPADPEHARTREYLACLSSVPWTARSDARLDLARAKAVLDAGHAGHAPAKERLVDYIAMRQRRPDVPSPAICLAGPSGVGKTSLARLLAAALGRACAWVACGGLSAAALCGSRAGRPGRIVEELRRVGVRNPVFILDEVDRVDDAGAAAALVELLDPAPCAAFRDHYLDLPLELSEALFVATAADLGAVPAMLRERMTMISLSGYSEADKRAVATDHLLPIELALHRLTADDVHITDEAIEALVRGYTRTAGVWGMAGALGTVCSKVVRRRAEGDDALVEVTPATLAEMLGPPEPPGARIAGRTGRPGVALGLCRTKAGAGAVSVVEASRLPGSGALTLTGRQGEVMRESAHTALSWLRANAGRHGLDPAFHQDTDIHVHVQAAEVPKEGPSAGVTMAAAMVSALTGRPLQGDVAMTGEIGLGGQVLPVGGIRRAGEGGDARGRHPLPCRRPLRASAAFPVRSAPAGCRVRCASLCGAFSSGEADAAVARRFCAWLGRGVCRACVSCVSSRACRVSIRVGHRPRAGGHSPVRATDGNSFTARAQAFAARHLVVCLLVEPLRTCRKPPTEAHAQGARSPWGAMCLPSQRRPAQQPVAGPAFHRALPPLRVDAQLEVHPAPLQHAEAVAQPVVPAVLRGRQAHTRRSHEADAHRQPVTHLRAQLPAGPVHLVRAHAVGHLVAPERFGPALRLTDRPTTGPPAPSDPAGSTASGPTPATATSRGR